MLRQAFSVPSERDEAALLIPLAHCQFQILLSIHRSLILRNHVLTLHPVLMVQKSHPDPFAVEDFAYRGQNLLVEFSPCLQMAQS